MFSLLEPPHIHPNQVDSKAFFFDFTNYRRLSDNKVKALFEYLHLHEHDLYRVPNSKYVFDTHSLQNPILLSHCLECTSDCCGGSPNAITPAQRTFSEPHWSGVIDLLAQSGSKPHGLIPALMCTKGNYYRAKEKPVSGCIARMAQDESHTCFKCALHAYALQHDIPPAYLKPVFCAVFPIFFVITPSGYSIVFCSTSETMLFSSFKFMVTNKRCVNLPRYLKYLERNPNTPDYSKEYKPAYLEQEETLRSILPERVCDSFFSHMRQISLSNSQDCTS